MFHDLIPNTKLTYSVESTFYLGDKNISFVAATKRNTFTLLPKYKTGITIYFARQHVVFDQLVDLKAMLMFQATLSPEQEQEKHTKIGVI